MNQIKGGEKKIILLCDPIHFFYRGWRPPTLDPVGELETLEPISFLWTILGRGVSTIARLLLSSIPLMAPDAAIPAARGTGSPPVTTVPTIPASTAAAAASAGPCSKIFRPTLCFFKNSTPFFSTRPLLLIDLLPLLLALPLLLLARIFVSKKKNGPEPRLLRNKKMKKRACRGSKFMYKINRSG